MLAARRCGCCKRKLEGDGLETRTVTASVPARVDYQLTLLGEELVNRCKISARCRSLPVPHVRGRPVRPDPAATVLPASKKARPPFLAIRPLTCTYLVVEPPYGIEP